MPNINIHRAIRLNKEWARQLQWNRTEVIVYVLSARPLFFQNSINIFAIQPRGVGMRSRNSYGMQIDQNKADQNLIRSITIWQAENGLSGKNADGIIGPKTLAKMLENEKFKKAHCERLKQYCIIKSLPLLPKSYGNKGFTQHSTKLLKRTEFVGNVNELLENLWRKDWIPEVYTKLLHIIYKGDLTKVSKAQFHTSLINIGLMKRMEELALELRHFFRRIYTKLPKGVSKITKFQALSIIDMFWEIYTGKWNTHSILNFWLTATGIAITVTGIATGGSIIGIAGIIVIAIYGVYNFIVDNDSNINMAWSINKTPTKSFRD